MPFIFVYGTLRTGESNDIHRAAARHSLPAPTLIGAGTVRGELVDMGDYPGLIPDTTASPVSGEVYEIDATLIPVLDAIEEVYPGRLSLFLRTVLPVQCGEASIDCIVYPVHADAVALATRIAGGDWIRHRLAR
ncbi:gamma-glutamylcyclotransferase family protein [Imbroritus primus]|uniref:gamma-glutamylcyclotransferase family protein n=1 Tax=Imbroritus primus TaxID=3058603 RepID=UPI003D161B06